ncbi:hypothetical protein EA772_01365 [Pedobacter sp. G11]|uniref:hypothetical protein n=1 Tax=Pedobacter sp. G11 TaxID=2482728 RepID=UPI000F5F04C8|nr:hypothetical protein [Pedobacter sp. G11]AZI24056.1 hypothetical protein EA772_01365 [Pedobacter sp. G11]
MCLFQALGGDFLLMESALVLWGRKERLFLSARGSKGVWGMEDFPTITAKHLAAAGFIISVYVTVYSFGLAGTVKVKVYSE